MIEDKKDSIVNELVRAIDLREHPIKKLKAKIRKNYYIALENFAKRHNESKSIDEHLNQYKKELLDNIEMSAIDLEEKNIKKSVESMVNSKFALWKNKYKYLLISDIALLFLDINKINIVADEMKEYMSESEWRRFTEELRVFEDINYEGKKIKVAEYIVNQYKKNKEFMDKPLKQFVVTATMSAGKSTLLNALVGKEICYSENMVCTQKIHSIFNKTLEDGYYSAHKDNIVIGLKQKDIDLYYKSANDILKNISTKFLGGLADLKIVFYDSPGINYSMDSEHKKITNEFILKNDYDVLLYVINFTQLETDDDYTHLKFIQANIINRTIVFLINKVDCIDTDKEDIYKILEKVENYIKAIGFTEPIICPVSSKAGVLIKKIVKEDLTKWEQKEFNNYLDKFERLNLEQYYNQKFPNICLDSNDNFFNMLYRQCGLAYVEKILKELV